MTLEQVRQILNYLRLDPETEPAENKVAFLDTVFEDLLQRMEAEAKRLSKVA